jgi:hypothetical protein
LTTGITWHFGNLLGGISGNETLSLARNRQNRQTILSAKACSSPAQNLKVASVLSLPEKADLTAGERDIANFSIQNGFIEFF